MAKMFVDRFEFNYFTLIWKKMNATTSCTIVKEVDTNYKENVPSTAA